MLALRGPFSDCTDLGKIAYEVATGVVSFCHDIEEKGLNVIIQSLVVQEELCQEAQVLAVDLEGWEGLLRDDNHWLGSKRSNLSKSYHEAEPSQIVPHNP